VDFTREPVIETVITPKEGSKLVIRSSKGNGQEEYFVDAVEVVTFGNSIFFRSLERPKPFLVPASDYEVLEVREARIVLKNVGLERSIKIGGGREAAIRAPKEPQEEKSESVQEALAPAESAAGKSDARNDRKRDRRRGSRKRRDRTDAPLTEEEAQSKAASEFEEKITLPPPSLVQLGNGESGITEPTAPSGSLFSNLFAPPPLISETIARYKEKFKDAFYTKEEQEARASFETPHLEVTPTLENPPNTAKQDIPLQQPAFGSFELSEEDEEEIYRQRHRGFPAESEEEKPRAQKQEEATDSNAGKLKEEEEVQQLHKQENLPD
jgi:hypothetical protein